jgi:putative iron-dependent peroxidase
MTADAAAALASGDPAAGPVPAADQAQALPQPQAVAAAPGSQPGPPQAVIAPLTRAAIFLVLTISPARQSADVVRALCGDLAGLLRAVGFRDLQGQLSCVTGFSAGAWDRLAGPPRPARLHPFREIRAGDRHAVATPGDILFHIRATRMDLCFELATQIAARLGDAVTVADEVHGFRYFDDRDLLGFVDGTENPAGQELIDAAIIGAEDPSFAGGSYVIVQKYLHDLDAWNALSTEQQERVIGRTKLADIELADEVKPSFAHNALTTIEENGEQRQIVRDNMPFGNIARGEFGTYFIGYARDPAVTEQMLQNMFVGSPPGNYDRLLDVSTAVTGTLFFVPSAPLLESLAEAGAGPEPASPAGSAVNSPSGGQGRPARRGDGSLEIGSLRGVSQNE